MHPPVATGGPDGNNAGSINQGVGMVFRRFGLALLLLVACHTAHADAATEFKTLLDEHWEWTLASAPIMASTMGDRRRNQD